MSGEDCTPITLNAVLKHLDRLKNGSRMVLLRGPPGSGKTPVAKSVARSLDSEKRLAASLFFDKGAASLELLVSALTAQIADRNSWYRSAVEQIIFDAPSILRQSPSVQLQRLIIDPMRVVYASQPDLIQGCFIVVDGLDKCRTPEDLSELESLLAGLGRLPTPFQFFLTCRPNLIPEKHGLPSSLPLAAHEDDLSSPPEDNHIGSVYSSDGSTCSKGQLKIMQLWDPNTEEVVAMTLTGHTYPVRSASFSSDGRRIVSSSDDETLRIWDAESGEAIGEPLRGHTNSLSSVSFSPDGKHIVWGSDDHTIRIRDAESREAVGKPLRGHTQLVFSISFSPDGKRIVSGSRDDTVRIWDAVLGEAIGEPLRGQTGCVRSVSFSPDGKRIVSGSDDHTIRIRDAESREAVGKPLRGHTNKVTSVSFSPDGKRIVSGSWDKTVRIWDAVSGEAIGEPLWGHTDAVNAVSFSPDGRRIVSGSWDDTHRIWDAESGVVIGEPLRGNTRADRSVSFSPDGKHIVSGSANHTIRIWDPLLTLSFLDSFF